jgi:uncharacterized protein YciI
MSLFAVIREAGPGWDPARPLREQPAWSDHAEFMNELAAEGFVVLGGPIGGGPTTLLIVDAPGEREIRSRLGQDPWTPMKLLRIAKVEPWEILLGTEVIEASPSMR